MHYISHNQLRRKLISIRCLLWIGVFFPATLLAEPNNNVDKYQSLVEQWLGLEKQNQTLNDDWHNNKPLLEQRYQLLKVEQRQLKQTLAKYKTNKSQVTEARTKLIEQQAQLEEQQAILSDWISRKLTQIQAQFPMLPPPLQTSWKSNLDQLSDHTSESEKLTLLLSMYDQKSQFDKRISHYQTELVAVNGQTLMVDQLYLGSQFGYYSTEDGSHIAYGHPTLSGWQWHTSEQLDSQQLRKAIAIAKKQQEAEFISLPVHLLDHKKQEFN